MAGMLLIPPFIIGACAALSLIVLELVLALPFVTRRVLETGALLAGLALAFVQREYTPTLPRDMPETVLQLYRAMPAVFLITTGTLALLGGVAVSAAEFAARDVTMLCWVLTGGSLLSVYAFAPPAWKRRASDCGLIVGGVALGRKALAKAAAAADDGSGGARHAHGALSALLLFLTGALVFVAGALALATCLAVGLGARIKWMIENAPIVHAAPADEGAPWPAGAGGRVAGAHVAGALHTGALGAAAG